VVLDASGKYVCPGFLDIHMHEDPYDAEHDRLIPDITQSMLRMGVTTAIGGNCGINTVDPAKYLDLMDRDGGAVNMGLLAGHTFFREAAGHGDKYSPITPEELKKLSAMTQDALEAGCFGVSFGIRYVPGISMEEMVETARGCKKAGKFVAAHVRDDAEFIFSAVNELFEIGRRLDVPVQNSHVGSMGGFGQMERLLERLHSRFRLDSAVESTVEAGRPDTITAEKLEALRRCGVTRVSVNPQSMSDAVLAAIGRRHSADDIRSAMELVGRAGFPHVNMDLIAGLPEDTAEGFRRTLDEVIAFGTDNITIHTLSLKKGSRITLEGSHIPPEGEVAAMLDYADPTLRGAGFDPYYLYRQKYMSGSFENVGWCRPGGTGWDNIYIM